jgi:cation diffusion facilitator family transporter
MAHADAHAHAHGHGHAHGLVDPATTRSREGLRVVSLSLAILLVTALAQGAVYLGTGSVALLADLTHNAGDALTAIPLGAAFLLRSRRAERIAGGFVVLAIFVSACVAGAEAVARLADPRDLDHLIALAVAGLVGCAGNELAARVRLRGGARLDSPALIADGRHARTDGLVSLGVVASAGAVALGFPLGDPLVGLAITMVILRVTWQSIGTIRDAPSE